MFAFLLRGLLCISLILNGSGDAMTSVHMEVGQMDDVVSVPEPAAAAMLPCHRHSDAAATVAAELPDAVHDEAYAKTKHPSPDCCKSGACQCACMHQAHAVIPVHVLRHDATGNANVVRSPQPGYPTPALPHLIRPPIG